MRINKNVIFTIALILIINCLIYIFFLINKTKNEFETKFESKVENKINNSENEIYFNLWLYIIKQKNEIGKFLKLIDYDIGYQYNSDKKYEIDKNGYTQLQDIYITFKYLEKNKTLKVYIRILDSQTKKEIEHLDISQEVLIRISSSILSILAQNLFVPTGEQKIDITKDFINYINFNFIFSPEKIESGEPIGQIIFERNKEKDRIFYFDFIKSNIALECTSHEYQVNIKTGECINM